jgi:hypothetical protein
MGLVGRLVLGVVFSICLGIIGNIAGWYTSFSVPEYLISVPFMPLLTGVWAAVGSYLGWRIDIDGNNTGGSRALGITLSLLGGIGGALAGFLYGSLDEGTRVWRYPVTQATILGATSGANILMLAFNLPKFLRSRQKSEDARERDYFRELRAINIGKNRNDKVENKG